MKQDNTIPLPIAKAWTEEWRAEESDYNRHNKCNAFLVPADDLSAVLAEIQNQDGKKMIRAYLGVDAATNEEKLIIVGTIAETQKDGSIIYRDIINGSVDAAGVGEGGSGIWDFSKPCPPECDPNSPLN